MTRWNAQQIAANLRRDGERVAGPAATMGGGRPNTFYILTREPTNEDLARITHQSGDREINLMRVNDAYLITVHGHAHGTPRFPRLGGGIQELSWMAHTHPMEHADQPRATPTDFTAMQRFYALAGSPSRGVDTRVVACRGGQVVMVNSYHYEPEPTLDTFSVMP